MWTFNTDIVAVTTASALQINGGSPDDGAVKTGARTASCNYTGLANSGDPWGIAALGPGITFAGGAILIAGQHGNIV